MGVNSLPKTVTRQRRGCDLNPGPSALESSTLTTRLPSHQPDADRTHYVSSCSSTELDCISLAAPSLPVPLRQIVYAVHY